MIDKEPKNLIECGTCGYPLTPEERTTLIEHNGVMCKLWVGLTDEDDIDWEDGGNLKDLVKAIEAKLKEKNT